MAADFVCSKVDQVVMWLCLMAYFLGRVPQQLTGKISVAEDDAAAPEILEELIKLGSPVDHQLGIHVPGVAASTSGDAQPFSFLAYPVMYSPDREADQREGDQTDGESEVPSVEFSSAEDPVAENAVAPGEGGDSEPAAHLDLTSHLDLIAQIDLDSDSEANDGESFDSSEDSYDAEFLAGAELLSELPAAYLPAEIATQVRPLIVEFLPTDAQELSRFAMRGFQVVLYNVWNDFREYTVLDFDEEAEHPLVSTVAGPVTVSHPIHLSALSGRQHATIFPSPDDNVEQGYFELARGLTTNSIYGVTVSYFERAPGAEPGVTVNVFLGEVDIFIRILPTAAEGEATSPGFRLHLYSHHTQPLTFVVTPESNFRENSPTCLAAICTQVVLTRI